MNRGLCGKSIQYANRIALGDLMPDEDNKERILDLKGEVCPFTLVKSKLKLEAMENGQVLTILVDNNKSAANVPRSLDLEGQNVLSVEKRATDGLWAIIVEKCV